MKSIILSVLAALPFVAGAQTIFFLQATGSPITTNSSQRGNAAADLNNDGNKDLVIGDGYGSSIKILLGNGTGQFSAASTVSNINGAISTVIADFNNDGKKDIATANYGGGNVNILLGNGAGSFTNASGSPITTSYLPYSIDAADFNMDGKMDLISSSVGNSDVVILLGNGLGGFSQAPNSPMAIGGALYHVVTGLFNADNYPDFAVADGNGNTVRTFFGNGTGSFSLTPSQQISVGAQPRTIAAKDLNNDGYIDLVTANGSGNNINILLGSSMGSFSTSTPIAAGSYAYQCVIADFNQDGMQDIAVTNGGSNNIYFFYGNGNGTFNTAPGSPLSIGNDPQAFVAADFNNDNLIDLAVGDFMGTSTNILLNKTSHAPCNLLGSFSYTLTGSSSVNVTSTSSGTTAISSYTWNFGDGTSANTASATHTYSTGGSYTITLTVSNNTSGYACGDSYNASINIASPVDGIPEINAASNIHIFPNPSSGLIQVEISQPLAATPEFILYNMLGQQELKMAVPLNHTSINTSNLKPGIYYYKINHESGTLKTGQLILEK